MNENGKNPETDIWLCGHDGRRGTAGTFSESLQEPEYLYGKDSLSGY